MSTALDMTNGNTETAVAVARLEESATTWQERASALIVNDNPTFEQAGEMLRDIKTVLGEIADTCDPVVKAANAAHKAATQQRNTLQGPLKTAETTIKRAMGDYLAKQERERREEEGRQVAEARKAEEEARLAQAEALEAAGDSEAAERTLDAPVTPPPPPPRPAMAAPKVAGIAARKTWKARVTDPMALIRGVAAGSVPAKALKIDEGWLNRQAQALETELAYPGVEAYSENTIAAGRR